MVCILMGRDLPWRRCGAYKSVGRQLFPLWCEQSSFLAWQQQTKHGATVDLCRRLFFVVILVWRSLKTCYLICAKEQPAQVWQKHPLCHLQMHFCHFTCRYVSSWILAIKNTPRLSSKLSIPAVARRGCAGATIPVNDVVNGLANGQIQVSCIG